MELTISKPTLTPEQAAMLPARPNPRDESDRALIERLAAMTEDVRAIRVRLIESKRADQLHREGKE